MRHLVIAVLIASMGCEEIDCFEVAPNLCIKDSQFEYDPSLVIDKLHVMLRCADEDSIRRFTTVEIVTETTPIWVRFDENGKKLSVGGHAHATQKKPLPTEYKISISADMRMLAHEIGHILSHQAGYSSLYSSSDKWVHRKTGLARVGDSVDEMFARGEYEELKNFECGFDFGVIEEKEE